MIKGFDCTIIILLIDLRISQTFYQLGNYDILLETNFGM